LSRLIVRCRSCTPASAVELTGWLKDRVAELQEGTPGLSVRLTRLARDLPGATVDDGWLVELELPGDPPSEPLISPMLSLDGILRDMRVLGLDPTLLAPVE
jgi:hypothetical protein